MRVLRLIGEIGEDLGTGPARQASLLTQGLSVKGVCSVVLTFKAGALGNHRLVNLKVCRPLLKIRSFHISLSMLTDSLKAKPDLIHVHGYRNFQSDLGAAVSLLDDRPLVLTTHGSVLGFALGGWDPKSMNLQRLYDRLSGAFALNRAEAIVATSDKEACELIRFGIPSKKVKIVPNSVRLPSVSERSVSTTDGAPFRLLMVTRITYIRNLELALRGLALALGKNKNIFLDIVGDDIPSSYTSNEDIGYKRKLLMLCDSLQLKDRVNFAGWRFGKKLWNMYENSDVFLWTSRYDSFATALVEAASFGLPIISTDVGVASEIIDSGRGGIMVPDDPAVISEAILRLLGDSKGRSEMAIHNKQKAREYSPEKITEKYLQIYNELVG